MISLRRVREFCLNYEKIENYEQAINDETQTWHCHHRLETHFSDGTERPKDAQLNVSELITLGMYFNRPPEEFIFLTGSDHMRVHKRGFKYSEEVRKIMSNAQKGKKASEETKQKLSEAHKGLTPWNKGTHISKETRNKISEACKGRKCSEETRKNMSKAQKGRTISEETRKKISEAKKGYRKGMHWKLVNGKRVWFKEENI